VALRFRTADHQTFEAKQAIKVALSPDDAVARSTRPRRMVARTVEDTELLPPVGDSSNQPAGEDLPEWAQEGHPAANVRAGHTTLHSANWTDATIPQLR